MLAAMHPLHMMLDSMDMMTTSPRYVHSSCRAPKLVEREADYALTLNAPGVKKEDIHLTATDGVLKIELPYSVMRLRIPRDADIDGASANHVDGILTLTLPKKELDGEHEGVTCDKSGQNPILGKRFHLPGHNYDLCQAEFDKLGEREKALYQMILPPPKRVKMDVPVAAAADTTETETEEEAESAEKMADGEAPPPRPYTFSLNAAGVRPSDLKLTIDDSLLSVSGETKATGARLRPQHYRLPRDADAPAARAASVDGLLTVTIPKRAFVTVTIPVHGAVETPAEEAQAETKALEGKEEGEDALMV